MRIMLDTNIIVSAALFPAGQVSAVVKELLQHHTVCICTFSIDELFRVTDRKFPHKRSDVDDFLRELSFELIYSPLVLEKDNVPAIRDPDDYPILLSAMSADVDVLLSGDNDFSCVDCDRPEILSPREFKSKYLY